MPPMANFKIKMHKGVYGKIMPNHMFYGDYAAAKHAETQAALMIHAKRMEKRASADLEVNHRKTGKSFIYAKHGEIDWHIILADESRPPRAGYIEGSTGVLRRAAGTPFAGGPPRRRRNGRARKSGGMKATRRKARRR